MTRQHSVSHFVCEIDSVPFTDNGVTVWRLVAGELLPVKYVMDFLDRRRRLEAYTKNWSRIVEIGNQAAQLVIAQDYVTDHLNVNGTDHATLHLIKAAFTPTPDMAPEDVEEATYTGYAPKNIDAWTVPSSVGLGIWETVPTTLPSFVGTDATTKQTIYGWWLADRDGQTVAFGTFPQPVQNVGDPDVRLSFVPVVQFTAAGWTANPVPIA